MHMKIKDVLPMGYLILAALSGQGQSVSFREEFKVSTSPSQIRLAKGSTDSVELTIERAKHFKGAVKFRVASPLPKGVSAIINAHHEKPDHFVMRLQADDSADVNEFHVLASCTINGKSKGAGVKVIVYDNVIKEAK